MKPHMRIAPIIQSNVCTHPIKETRTDIAADQAAKLANMNEEG